MNRDKLIEMLMQAGFEYTSDLISKMDKFENLLEIEREACAKMCEGYLFENVDERFASLNCAALIRARGLNAKS